MDSPPSQTLAMADDSRNWLELPRDVALMILMKLSIFEILESAQFVCKSWYNLCKDPSMWRVIRMQNMDEPELQDKHQKMLYNAIDRTSGGLVCLDIEGFGSDQLISYFAHRSNQLKHLRLACCYSITADALLAALPNLPQLEELELTLCPFSLDQTNDIIRLCPFLKTFKLNQQGSRNPSLACDDEAAAIAENMHELRRLQLIGNGMTNTGLKLILDNCPHLEFLDLRACFHLDLLAEDLGKRCARQVRDFRAPHDPTDDYGFLTTDYDSDFDEIYVDEMDDMDFMSDNEYYEFSDDDDASFAEDYF